MLGEFINRVLVLLLGYAYPGFECYKIVEKNKVDIEELRFWCKYWIIVALFTVLEKFPDIFLGWLPMYGEMKVVFFIYLWYPKTKGTGYIYEVVLKPIVSKHENDIDRKLSEYKARAWDYVIFYWQYLAKHGHTAFIQALQHVVSQSSRFSANNNTAQKKEVQGESETRETQSSFMQQRSSVSNSKKWPPSPTLEEEQEPQIITMDGVDQDNTISVKDRISNARARLRRLDSQQQQQPQSPRSPRTPQRRPHLQ
ncbi:hypothetical protein RJT34_23746 [Clitoria ternatea]|uniref:HVA22-like protein n=1 Tax=Clitoria ternatea TaxID=43366 RepID=A0AAN9IIP5_CLITE